ncbi:hypothetical protein GOBAR_DD04454 [Gossypium barbadense]|nr:hypothetical protein GOBAR_DD04454 [Gossypium barbadense]
MSLFRLLLLRSINRDPPKPAASLLLTHFFHNVALNPASENPIQGPPTPPHPNALTPSLQQKKPLLNAAGASATPPLFLLAPPCSPLLVPPSSLVTLSSRPCTATNASTRQLLFFIFSLSNLILFQMLFPNTQAVNSDTFNIMVNECFKLGNIEEAIKTFKKVGTKPGSKPFAMDVAGYNNIITRFCEHGMLSEAEKFFQELCGKSLTPDVPMYRTMIDAYLKAGRVDDALRSFTKMVETGLRVVASFGTRVFSEFLKNGKNLEVATLLAKMGEKEPKPDASIYDVVVRGLCNADELDKSLDVLDQMMKYSIGVTPALQEFVRGAFGKVGRNEELDRVLNENRWRFPGRQPRPFGQSPRSPSGPAEMGEWQSSGSPQMAGGQQFSGASQMPGQHSLSWRST